MLKNIFGFLLLIGVCYGSCPSANKCQCLDLPDKTLRQFHAGCNTNIRNCHPDYVAAMHRYCNSIKFPWYKPEARLMAASREHANNVIYFSCVKSAFAGYVAISELKMYFSHCHHQGSQTGTGVGMKFKLGGGGDLLFSYVILLNIENDQKINLSVIGSGGNKLFTYF